MWGGKRGDRMKEDVIDMHGFDKCMTDQYTDRPTNQWTNGQT